MYIVNNTHCYECHRAVAVAVFMGEQDEDGRIDQESGGAFCVDCLLEAIARAQDDGKDNTPPGALAVSLRRERLRRLEQEAAEAEAAALLARVNALEMLLAEAQAQLIATRQNGNQPVTVQMIEYPVGAERHTRRLDGGDEEE
jgi:hypothetical protein